MVYSIEKVLNRYGSDLVLRRGNEETAFRGFLQHSGSRSWQSVEKAYSPLGRIPRGQYILIAPLSVELKETDMVICDSLAVTIGKVETVLVGDRAVYQWGLCVEKGGDDTWAMQS